MTTALCCFYEAHPPVSGSAYTVMNSGQERKTLRARSLTS